MAIEMSIGRIVIILNVKISVAQTSGYINGFNTQNVGPLELWGKQWFSKLWPRSAASAGPEKL